MRSYLRSAFPTDRPEDQTESEAALLEHLLPIPLHRRRVFLGFHTIREDASLDPVSFAALHLERTRRFLLLTVIAHHAIRDHAARAILHPQADAIAIQHADATHGETVALFQHHGRGLGPHA